MPGVLTVALSLIPSMSLIGLLVFCLRCFSVPLHICASSELGVQFRRVSIQSRLEFAERSRLYLVCVLQFTDPLGFLSFQSRYLSLNLHALLVFLINLSDQLVSLLETLLLLLHHTHFHGLVFLVAHHLLHALGLKLFSALLNLDHLLVLGALCFLTLGLAIVLFSLGHLLVADGFFLVKTVLLIAHLKFAFLLLSLHLEMVLLVGRFSISLADVDDVGCFLLSLLDLLPGLENKKNNRLNGHLPFTPLALRVRFYWREASRLPVPAYEKLSGQQGPH